MRTRTHAKLIMLDARSHDALPLSVIQDRPHILKCRGQLNPPGAQWRVVERAVRDRRGNAPSARSTTHEFLLLECPDPVCGATCVVPANHLAAIVSLALPATSEEKGVTR